MAVSERAIGLTSHMKAMGLLDSARVLYVHLLHHGVPLHSCHTQVVALESVTGLPPRLDHSCWRMAGQALHRNKRRDYGRHQHPDRPLSDELVDVRHGTLREESAARCNHLHYPCVGVVRHRDGVHRDLYGFCVRPYAFLPAILPSDRYPLCCWF